MLGIEVEIKSGFKKKIYAFSGPTDILFGELNHGCRMPSNFLVFNIVAYLGLDDAIQFRRIYKGGVNTPYHSDDWKLDMEVNDNGNKGHILEIRKGY